MDLGMKGWNELGVVGTIYEEEDENSALSSSFSTIPSLESSPSNTPQLSRQDPPWASGRRHDPDVVIHVQGSCFRLHKQALIAKSAYLKRQLAEFPEITLSPPLSITAQTFASVTEFCYGTHVAVTPFNVAALRTAAELLGMTGTGGAGGENLEEITEAYFRRVVAVNKECASIVLQSCFPLLPEAEVAACLVSRCIEALSLTASEADGDGSCLEGFKNVRMDDLKLILESVSQRLTDCHDLLYRIIDIYLKENIAWLSEEEKIQMCNYIDCSILSAKLLMHAVQNPRMPLRFVVQAMFLQQLNTRHSIISAADRRDKKEPRPAATLGAILKRDAALRQVSQLKAVMTATTSRIQTLEEELSGMRKLLAEPETLKNRIDSGRSASFRFSSDGASKVARGQVGSVSSLSYVIATCRRRCRRR
ncbi:BTB/POZ domain-containing protein At3g49900 [Salvia miltiorrhiza]|uniref:BTB/POZ domain-containing protein At3g49900 n=1 Tax=Salvia miltiorrhiza TaxID=226208 RepID=UPI0025ACA6A5|nr:BTB/POZ domain-containing protein At3g49900 [Salvia miltiorrhiza]